MKSKVLGLGGILEASYIFYYTLREVGFFPILVYFYPWAIKGAVWIVCGLFYGC